MHAVESIALARFHSLNTSVVKLTQQRTEALHYTNCVETHIVRQGNVASPVFFQMQQDRARLVVLGTVV